MRASGEKLEGQRRERGQDCLDEGLPAGPVLGDRAVHAVQQLRGGDGGDPGFFVRAELLFQAPAHLGHDIGKYGFHILGETRIRQGSAGKESQCLAQRPSAPRGRRPGCGVVWMHDDEGRAFVVHYDNSLVPGDRFAGMPGNPHFLGPDRRHRSMRSRSRTEPYCSVRLCLLAVPVCGAAYRNRTDDLRITSASL